MGYIRSDKKTPREEMGNLELKKKYSTYSEKIAQINRLCTKEEKSQ